MTGIQILGGLLGAGAAAGLLLFIKGLRSGPDAAVIAPSRWLVFLGRLDPRRLRGQSPRVAACAAGAGAVAWWTGWPAMAVIGFAGCWHLPRALGPDRSSKHAIEVSEAVAVFAEMLRDTLSAAAGLQQAVAAVCPLAPGPIAAPCADLAERIDIGTPLAEAIAAWADVIADRDADVVAGCLVIAAKKQSGNTAAVLHAAAASARQWASIRRRAVASQARSRTAVRITIGVVLGLFCVLVFADRSFMQPYDSALGQAVLLVVAAVFAVALRWMDNILHPAPEPRILTGLGTAARSVEQEVSAW